MSTISNPNQLNVLIKKVPPDGGYGWVIVFANALSNFLTVSLILCFGLIFNDTFTKKGFSATQITLIINLNAAFGMMTGLINGALLKKYGFRKVAFAGAFLFTAGVVSTSFARGFYDFLISYGLITSLGGGFCQSSFALALNTYFKKKRSIAMGYAITITGFGPVLVPQLLDFLMKRYSASQTTLIFAGLSLHIFVAAALLQPVKRHLKLQEDTEVAIIEARPSPVTKPAAKPTTFDFDLVKDPIFVNIVLGMALALFAELNFSVLTPFMLLEFKLNNDQVAMFISVQGVVDIIFRFFAPYIGNYFKKPPRLMYAYTLILLIITRFLFLLSTSFYYLLLIALGLGLAKGVRKVYMGLVIPAHVPLDKLPSASGMEMMMNGICIMIGGPILGLVRDASGSYQLCVIVMNFVTFMAIMMWVVEAFLKKCR